MASGGMGDVFEASGSGSTSDVVIKVPATNMPNGTPMSPNYHAMIVEKLRSEARILKNISRTKPASIVRYVDESKNQDEFFLVVERIRGRTLTKSVSSGGMHEHNVLKLSMDILEGLEFLHKHNTIYRDMKPDNVILADNGHCVLIDFGAAKQGLTQTSGRLAMDGGTTLGTPEWTCPEQMTGRSSAECDLYAFGRVMFFMITGIKPSRFTAQDGSISKRLTQIKPSTSTPLADLVDKMMDLRHSYVHTASEAKVLLASMAQSVNVAPQRQYQQRDHFGQSTPSRRSPHVVHNSNGKSFIVIEGSRYEISSGAGGAMIGKIHDELACVRSGGGCNKNGDGHNLFVGWMCPSGCRCDYNPGHMINKHHMKIWLENDGKVYAINNDPKRRSAIHRDGIWHPMSYGKKTDLRNRDQVALLYNEKKGPYMCLTFYKR